MNEKGTKEIILDVPYREKNEAKQLGARWDPGLKKWFIPIGKDAAPFKKWLPQEARNASLQST